MKNNKLNIKTVIIHKPVLKILLCLSPLVLGSLLSACKHFKSLEMQNSIANYRALYLNFFWKHWIRSTIVLEIRFHTFEAITAQPCFYQCNGIFKFTCRVKCLFINFFKSLALSLMFDYISVCSLRCLDILERVQLYFQEISSFSSHRYSRH